MKKPRFRSLAFPLRTLLLLVSVACVLLYVEQYYVGPYRAQRSSLSAITKLGATCVGRPGSESLRSLYGDNLFQKVLHVDMNDCDAPDTYVGHLPRLPFLRTLVVSGPKFSDRQLSRLRLVNSLRRLVLDSTNVSPQGIKELQKSRPELAIHKSMRRSISAMREWGGKVECFRNPSAPSWLSSAEHAQIAHKVVVGSLMGGDEYKTVFNSRLKANDADLELLAHFDRMEVLWIFGPISDKGIAYLARFKSLREVELYGTTMTDEGVEHLLSLPNLKVITLCGSKLTLDGASRLVGAGVRLRLGRGSTIRGNVIEDTEQLRAYFAKRW